jgi:hypothetical protein
MGKYLLRIEKQWQQIPEEPTYKEVEASSNKEALETWLTENEKFESEEMRKVFIDDITILQIGKRVVVFDIPDSYVIEITKLD